MTLRKDFILGDKWDESAADSVDSFIQDITDEQVERRTGTYTGTGSEQQVLFEHCLGVPGMVVLTNTLDASSAVVGFPLSSGHITSWTKNSFTLRAASTLNLPGKLYAFFLVSS